MKIRRTCYCALVLALPIAVACCRSSKEPDALSKQVGDAPPRANIILLTVDTLRADHMELYGYPRRTMPAVSAFAQTAVIFDNAVVPRGTTRPSYASMLTGLYPARHGVRANGVVLHEDNVTLPEMLKAAGYHTAAFVSNGTLKKAVSGLGQGFDVYVCDSGGDGESGTAKDMTTALLEWLDADPPQPFFLFTNLIDPHGPYSPPERFRTQFRSKRTRRLKRDKIPASIYVEGELNHFDYVDRYDGDILHTDELLGKTMAKLKDKGLWDEAFVVFTADHGECMGQHDLYYTHQPMVWEETMHVPLAIRLPRSIAERRGIKPKRVRGLCSPMDLPPTLLAYLGISRDVKFDGRSLLPLMKGAGDDGRALLMEYPSFLRSPDGKQPGVYALRRAGHKLTRSVDETTGETLKQTLYNLVADRTEQRPISFDPKRPGHRALSRKLDSLLNDLRTYEPPFKVVVYELPFQVRHPFVEQKRKEGKIAIKVVPTEQIERLRALGYIQ